MCVLLTLTLLFAYVEDSRSEVFCKLELVNPVTQLYCFDPRNTDGLRRCNTFERADVIVRPGCSTSNHHSNNSLSPMRCVDGNWEDIGTCKSEPAPTPGVEGSECTWNGAKGKCVNIYRCLSAAEHLFQKELPHKCEYEGDEPVICCTDCTLVNDTRQIIYKKRLGLLYKNGGKAHDNCIDYIDRLDYPCSINMETEIEWTLDNNEKCYNALVHKNVRPSPGVSFADERLFPHLALLGFGPDVLSLRWLCSGTLISPNFILTTAHCVTHPVLGPATHVAFETVPVSVYAKRWQQHRVKSNIPHPDYKETSIYNDIALLELEEPILLEDIRPACLHVDGNPDNEASAIIPSILNDNDLFKTVEAVRQDKILDKLCRLTYGNGYNSTTQMCYDDLAGTKVTCNGDIEGPLQSTNHYPEQCVNTILGLMSYGKECRERLISGVFTRVQHYVPWIESVVWP